MTGRAAAPLPLFFFWDSWEESAAVGGQCLVKDMVKGLLQALVIV